MFSTSTNFTYAGQDSSDFGIILARTSGLPTYQFGLSYQPIFEKIKYVDKIYFYGNDKNTHEFDLEMYKQTMWTVQDRIDISKWLFQNSFQDLIFANPSIDTEQINQVEDIVYNCMPIGRLESVDLGGLYGIKVKFMNSLPYATTQTSIQYWDLSDNTGTVSLTDPTPENRGNLNEYFYDIQVDFTLKSTSTGISITNQSDGYTFAFSGLSQGESITVKNQIGEITSSTGLNRISKFNLNWFRLPSGISNLNVTGACTLTLTARYPIIV